MVWAMPALSPEHLRAARFLLGWSASELAQACGLAGTTIRRFELGLNPSLRPRTERDIRAVLEEQGIIFEDGEGDGPFVACSDGLVVRRRQHNPTSDDA